MQEQLAQTLDTNMLLAGGVLLAAYVLIFSEVIHRMHAALIGAAVMVMVGMYNGFYTQEAALLAIDANTLLLLCGMMMMVSLLKKTGGFEYIAIRVAKLSTKPAILLVNLSLAVSLISMILDNVTTVIIFAPLTVLICRMLGLNPLPYLMAEAMLSNIGGIATLVGDPPNIMIGSAANIEFNRFLYHMGPIVMVSWVMTTGLILLVFRRELEQTVEYKGSLNLDESRAIHDRKTLYTVLGGLLIIVSLFFIHHHLHLYPSYVSFIGLALTLAILQPEPDEVLDGVEWPVLVFFAGLFVIVGGVEQSGLLGLIGRKLSAIASNPDQLLIACLALMWAAALLSAIVDNIPFTVTMIPIVLSLDTQGVNITPMWWALALGVGLGGNGSHIGATANIICVAESERCGLPEARITPGLWIRRGAPVMIAGLTVASLVFAVFFDFFSS